MEVLEEEEVLLALKKEVAQRKANPSYMELQADLDFYRQIERKRVESILCCILKCQI